MITYGNGPDNLSKGNSTATDVCALTQGEGADNFAKAAGTAVNNFTKAITDPVDSLNTVFDWDEFIILTT